MTISLDTVKRAIKMLNSAEVQMHKALDFNERNPIYSIQQEIIAFMTKEPCLSFMDIVKHFYHGGNEAELTEAWKILKAQGTIEVLQTPAGVSISPKQMLYKLSPEILPDDEAEPIDSLF
jgi:5-bromo-4-chloroindolyl phosphate hydrolysis protein